jgi:hypothetical protein
MSLRIPVSIAVVAAVAIMAACNGYNSGGGVVYQGNNPPIASIVANPTSVPLDDGNTTVVTLDGSASTDPDGTVVSFLWTVPGGQFVGGTTERDEVIQVTFPGTEPTTVTLVVTDDGGKTDAKQVTIGLI